MFVFRARNRAALVPSNRPQTFLLMAAYLELLNADLVNPERAGSGLRGGARPGDDD